jgi:NDP-hexose-3-ketoreductase
MKIAILNCSDIAKRRMIPAFQSTPGIEITIVCSRDEERAKEYAKQFRIPKYTTNPEDINDVDLVYISSPPSEHYNDMIKFVSKGINILCEKSLTTNSQSAADIIRLAESNGVIIQENYAFPFHTQWKWITENLHRIGRIQYIRSSFEFPPRNKSTDFRYNKKLGGGALYDAGGYPIKLASLLLGYIDPTRVIASTMWSNKHQVDLSGNSYISDENGTSAFLTWGFQSKYRCSLEIIGTEGVIEANKIFSPRADEEVLVRLYSTEGRIIDGDSFICDHFYNLIADLKKRIETKDNSIHKQIIKQSNLQQYVSTASIGTFVE